MKTCKVKPTANSCSICNDIDDFFGKISDCDKCSYNTTEYELLQIGKGIFGAYAFVLANGEVQQVSLDRVYDIKERGDQYADKNLTDNEITKALEDLVKCNNNEIDCGSCSLSVFYPRCPEEVGELALDLINRLQEDKNDLFYKLTGVMHSVDKWLDGDELKQDEVNRAATMREKTLKIVEDLQAENKRLKAPTTDWLVRGISPEQLEKEKIQALMDIAKKYAKAEAYKEFAEKLHEELRIYGIKDKFNKSVFLNVVDKAKKELVGDKNV